MEDYSEKVKDDSRVEKDDIDMNDLAKEEAGDKKKPAEQIQPKGDDKEKLIEMVQQEEKKQEELNKKPQENEQVEQMKVNENQEDT